MLCNAMHAALVVHCTGCVRKITLIPPNVYERKSRTMILNVRTGRDSTPVEKSLLSPDDCATQWE